MITLLMAKKIKVVSETVAISESISTKTKSVYLVKKRIVEGSRVIGFILAYRGNDYKISKSDLIELVDSNPSTVLVDFSGGDNPVYLTTINVNGKKELRTIWDKTIKNNLNKVKKIRLISANRYKLLSKDYKPL